MCKKRKKRLTRKENDLIYKYIYFITLPNFIHLQHQLYPRRLDVNEGGIGLQRLAWPFLPISIMSSRNNMVDIDESMPSWIYRFQGQLGTGAPTTPATMGQVCMIHRSIKQVPGKKYDSPSIRWAASMMKGTDGYCKMNGPDLAIMAADASYHNLCGLRLSDPEHWWDPRPTMDASSYPMLEY